MTLTPDEMYVSSKRYGNEVGIILQMPDGRIALLNAQRKLHGFYSSWETLVLALSSLRVEPPRERPVSQLRLSDLLP